ncbi:MAG: hypothetical protein NVV74_02485 [Magnetospirillum sp.]|nr:hypothetical protein [Magnetospirillum sp.]
MRSLIAALALLLPAMVLAQPAMGPSEFIQQAAADAIADAEAGRMAQSTATAAPSVQQAWAARSGPRRCRPMRSW